METINQFAAFIVCIILALVALAVGIILFDFLKALAKLIMKKLKQPSNRNNLYLSLGSAALGAGLMLIGAYFKTRHLVEPEVKFEVTEYVTNEWRVETKTYTAGAALITATRSNNFTIAVHGPYQQASSHVDPTGWTHMVISTQYRETILSTNATSEWVPVTIKDAPIVVTNNVLHIIELPSINDMLL